MKYKKTAIIFGITGQDGAYLSHFLLQKGYRVIGTTRNKSIRNLHRLKKLKVFKRITLLKGVATDLNFCKKAHKVLKFEQKWLILMEKRSLRRERSRCGA